MQEGTVQEDFLPLTVSALSKAATSEDGLKPGKGYTADPGPPLDVLTVCCG